jgi:hypothetical protein
MSDQSFSDRNPRPAKPESGQHGTSSSDRRKKYREFGPAAPSGGQNQGSRNSRGRRRGGSRSQTPRSQSTNPHAQQRPAGEPRPGSAIREGAETAGRPPRDRNPQQGGNRPPVQRNQSAGQQNQQRREPVQEQQNTSPQGTAQDQTVSRQQHNPRPQQFVRQTPRPQRERSWDRNRIKAEETFEDIRRDNERIEKEIWLEIAGIHTLTLD